MLTHRFHPSIHKLTFTLKFTLIAALSSPASSAAPAPTPPFEIQYGTGPDPRAVCVADFTSDGWPDAAIACNDPDWPEVSLLRGTGGGRFARPAPAAIQWKRPHEVASGDFDGDGHMDLAVSSGAARDPAIPCQVRIFFGDGAGDFPRSTEAFARHAGSVRR